MTFPINTTIPAAGNDPSIDQQPMQTNFANINSYLGIDHTTPGTNPGDGQHNQVTFHINQAAPSMANAVSGLFANSATGSQLFFQNASGILQITNSSLLATAGNAMFPGGLQIRAGSGSASVAGVTNTFSPKFPTACLSVVASGSGFGFVISVPSFNDTNFNAFSSLSSTTIRYIAVGY